MNACRWDYPGTWIDEAAFSWRTTGDINASWESIKGILAQNLYLSAYCSKGHYNDMDMLEVGRNIGTEEDKTHFGMWCIMNSPLLIGCDVRSINTTALNLLKNTELIALNQDTLYQQAHRPCRRHRSRRRSPHHHHHYLRPPGPSRHRCHSPWHRHHQWPQGAALITVGC